MVVFLFTLPVKRRRQLKIKSVLVIDHLGFSVIRDKFKLRIDLSVKTP